MTNLAVAKCFLGNALAYGEHSKDTSHESLLFKLQTVNANLTLIKELLEKPEEENQEYDWDDFK